MRGLFDNSERKLDRTEENIQRHQRYFAHGTLKERVLPTRYKVIKTVFHPYNSTIKLKVLRSEFKIHYNSSNKPC